MTSTVEATSARVTQPAMARRVLGVSIAITVLLFVVPFGERIGYPLVLLSTLVHELGHGLGALLAGGRFGELRIFGDASGYAVTAVQPGAFRQALVSAGGLVGPAVAAALGFLAGRTARASRLACLALGLFGLVALVLWVRGLAGVLVALLFALLSLVAGLAKPPWVPQLWLLFTAVQLALSVFSRGDYLFTATARTGRGALPSDAAQLADALIGPYWFWGGVCGLVSVAALLLGVVIFFRRGRGGLGPARPPRPAAPG